MLAAGEAGIQAVIAPVPVATRRKQVKIIGSEVIPAAAGL
jgi:hypothetical protein